MSQAVKDALVYMCVVLSTRCEYLPIQAASKNIVLTFLHSRTPTIKVERMW
jgi:hypothetical protein